jgi:hypothetical protein
MKNPNLKARFEPMLYRPNLPQPWYFQEQLDRANNSYISFVRMAKVHHKGELEKIYATFCEFPEGTESFRYTVRGGRNAKPDIKTRHFNDIESAEAFLISIMESTNAWVEEINSPAYIKSYEDTINKQVQAEEKYRKTVREALAI